MLLTIQNFADLFVDACLRDDKSELLFLSLFGRDTSILQFFSAFSLKRSEGGLIEGANAQLVLHDDAMRQHTVVVSDVDRLEKLTGRLPSENLFGPLTHAWLFDPCLTRCDRGKREAWVLDEGTGERDAHKLWRRITELSPVPLLEHWREAIIDGLGERLVRPLVESNAVPLGAIGGYRVHLPTAFEAFVSTAVARGLLLPSGEQHKTLDTVAGLYRELARLGLDRSGLLVALGGGVVGDLTGFVAATTEKQRHGSRNCRAAIPGAGTGASSSLRTCAA